MQKPIILVTDLTFSDLDEKFWLLYGGTLMDHKPKLLDLVRNKIHLKHYSIRTERAYVDWVKRFLLFHHKRHPTAMAAAEIHAFLSHLAVEGKVAASTQSQALSTVAFLSGRFSTGT
jgi:hypothetical protein